MISLIVFSCNGKREKTTMQNIRENTTHVAVNTILADSIVSESVVDKDDLQYDQITEKEAITFLKKFKQLVLKQDIEQLTELINFPLISDCWYMVHGNYDTVSSTVPFMKKDFIQHHSKIIDNEMIRLLKLFDFNKSFQEGYHKDIRINKIKTISMVVSFYTNDDAEPNSVKFYIGIGKEEIEPDWKSEWGYIYHFKKINGEIKLWLIQPVG